MSALILDVADIGKCYATYRSNLQRFAGWFGVKVKPASEYWAVRDVSFQMKSGEGLALIGQNGAGKSTLLKLITGTIQPTEGAIGKQGAVSAILELGLGFNPEFTGRENVYQAGGLLGHPHELLTSLMPDIEEFAEIGEFFDKPLRIYSSGMQARLAFALATAVRPEILIVDEVLSVGDSYFQHKSFARIRKFQEEGTAILLVTHSMADVRTLCKRVILLDKGRVLKDGAPDEVVDYYNAITAERENAKLTIEQRRQKDGWLLTRSGTFKAHAKSLELIDAISGETVKSARVGQKLRLKLVATFAEAVPTVILGCLLRDRAGNAIWGTNTWFTKQPVQDVKPGEDVVFMLDFRCEVGPGSYSWTTALTSSHTHISDNFEWIDNALVFDVINVDFEFFVGSARLPAVFTIERPGDVNADVPASHFKPEMEL